MEYNHSNKIYFDGVDRFIVITVATERNDNLNRFEESCKKNDIPYIILGLGDKWDSGHAENGVLITTGGAQKIIYLRDEIKNWDNLENTIILFTDSYDVIFNDGPKEILKKFREFNTPILFSAEKTCWPNEDLMVHYPDVNSEYKYLNSGGFIGYGNEIMKMVNTDIGLHEDDQEYYSKYYLNSLKSLTISTENDDFEFKKSMFKYLRSNYTIDDVLCDFNPINGDFGLLFGAYFKQVYAIENLDNIKNFNLNEIYDKIDEKLTEFDDVDILFIYDIKIDSVSNYEEFAKKFKEVILLVDFSEGDFTIENINNLLPSFVIREWSKENKNGWLSLKKETDMNESFITLDFKQKLFQTLNLATEEVYVEGGRIHNSITKTTPSILHGNGGLTQKTMLGKLYNDLNTNSLILNGENKILINVFFDFKVKDIDQVFDQIRYLNYPKYNIDLRIYYGNDNLTYKIDRFIEKFNNDYQTIVKIFNNVSKGEKRDMSLEDSLTYDVDYVINIDCNYIFRNRESLKLLMSENKNIISPMIVGEGTEWVNFLFRTDSDGYYIDSVEQESIKKYESHGVFSVGFTTGIILFKSSIIPDILGLYSKDIEKYDDDDFDICFSRNLIRRGYQLWVTNNNYFGGII